MTSHPSGTVTFLFSDIEGSTRLAQAHPDQWEDLRARHHAILYSVMAAHSGHVFQIVGDAFCVSFHAAQDGVNAALDVQRRLQNEDWGETPIKCLRTAGRFIVNVLDGTFTRNGGVTPPVRL